MTRYLGWKECFGLFKIFRAAFKDLRETMPVVPPSPHEENINDLDTLLRLCEKIITEIEEKGGL